ncbi:MAG TPA: helix-turn-helix transcriptional regulator, partial [Anaerolineae bacterium]|nr:helix-turn-helix transcriptional regulator [Anaerolineae bacterium]
MEQSKRDPQDFLPLTPAVFNILLALAEGEKHGYGIMQEVAAHTGGKLRLGPGTLYGSI